MRVLLLDFETNGLDTSVCRIVEVGAALIDTERAPSPLVTLSSFVRLPAGVELPVKVQALTKIGLGDLKEFGRDLPDVLLDLGRLAAEHDAERVCGHNFRAFDSLVLRAEVARLVAPPREITRLLELPIIDTIEDLDFPEEMTCRKLSCLAGAHGFLPGSSHRALDDAITAGRLLSFYPFHEVLRRADSPSVLLRACCGFEDNWKAKELRFGWHPETKTWRKAIKEVDADRIRERAKEIGLELRRVA